ncbi:hypothetical protein ABZT08_09510 [Streptomyces sp. NPDC005526]|uniref:hypothetical protein n=1 Tax=Streptomyces sp. NPDC005526 TaxID=3156885 RepID=UPI0033AB1BC8
MQWTNDSGAAYGEDPYAGAGYPYAHGQGHGYGHGYTYEHGHGGTATTDTATLPWSPQPAYGTHPGQAAFTTGTYPHAPGTHPYPAGPGPATTAWDAPHGDALTVPPPEYGTPVPAVPQGGAEPPPGPEPEAAGEAVRPVFVDSSGRRQRRVLRATRLLLIPAGGYVALLISTVLGGPSISSPVVPQPHSPHPAAPGATAPDAAPGTDHSSGTTDSVAAPRNSPSAATRAAAGPTGRPAGSSTPVATSGTTAAPTRTTSPAPTPTATTTAAPTSAFQGRGAGSTHNPVK